MISSGEFDKVRKTLLGIWKSKRSSFYREKYKKAGIDLRKVSSVEDFEKLPFLNRDEIVGAQPFDRLYIPESQIVSFSLSSGTTSQNEPFIVPMQKWDDVTLRDLYKKLRSLAIKRIMVIANVSYSNVRATDWLLDKKLSRYPLILGNIQNLELSSQIAAKLQIDGIETNPSALFFLVPFLKEVYPLDNIRYISMGGEYVTEQRLKFFKQYFRNAFFDFRFGGAENQVLKGWRCKYLAQREPRFFHPTSEYYYFEVINSETGQGVDLGEEGELVETSKDISAFPLIRYRSGDIVRLTSMKCPCGRSELLEVLGRARGDSFHLYGGTLHVEEIEKALAKVKDMDVLNYQMHIYEVINENKLKPSLVLELSLRNADEFAEKGIAEIVERNLRISSKLTLADLVEQNLFMPLEVRFKKSLVSVYKTLKIVPHLD